MNHDDKQQLHSICCKIAIVINWIGSGAMLNTIKQKLILGITLVCFTLLTGCGTIFYPERRGNSTHLDPGVAILDGIGLLFFLIPGVVAYAVDFTTGCIYMSGSGGSSRLAMIVPLDKDKDLQSQVNQALYSNYGVKSNNAFWVDGVVGFNNWYQIPPLNNSGKSKRLSR